MNNENEMARIVRRAVEGYFKDLDGEKPCHVYNMVIGCVEKPLIESVLHRVQGNQTRASASFRFLAVSGKQAVTGKMAGAGM
jgi:Fis family transcriptional regulator